ncbi:MAG: PaaI family thioesterase [Thermoleophilia bacterium]|nr:PaaI family thioesterase [Thermoleophilia bacterium]
MAWDQDVVASTWQVGDQLPSHNDDCAVCGTDSSWTPLTTAWTVRPDDRVGAALRFDERHQGAPAYAHGGAVAAVLDDAMGYVSFLVQRIFVTAHLEVDYARPVLLGHDYEAVAWCDRIEGRKLYLAAELRDSGDAIARASGLFIAVDIEHFRP